MSVTNLVTNLSLCLVITKFGDKFVTEFVTKFVTKIVWAPIWNGWDGLDFRQVEASGLLKLTSWTSALNAPVQIKAHMVLIIFWIVDYSRHKVLTAHKEYHVLNFSPFFRLKSLG